MQATPRPLFGARAEAGADLVGEDVVDRFGEVLLAVDDAGAVAVPEEVAPPFVPSVEPEGVDPVQSMHPAPELVDGRAEHQVVVRRHQAVGVDVPAESLDAVGKKREEAATVDAVAVDRGVVDAERRHVKDPVGKLSAQKASHDADRSRPIWPTKASWKTRRCFVTKDTSLSNTP